MIAALVILLAIAAIATALLDRDDEHPAQGSSAPVVNDTPPASGNHGQAPTVNREVLAA